MQRTSLSKCGNFSFKYFLKSIIILKNIKLIFLNIFNMLILKIKKQINYFNDDK